MSTFCLAWSRSPLLGNVLDNVRQTCAPFYTPLASIVMSDKRFSLLSPSCCLSKKWQHIPALERIGIPLNSTCPTTCSSAKATTVVQQTPCFSEVKAVPPKRSVKSIQAYQNTSYSKMLKKRGITETKRNIQSREASYCSGDVVVVSCPCRTIGCFVWKCLTKIHKSHKLKHVILLGGRSEFKPTDWWSMLSTIDIYI